MFVICSRLDLFHFPQTSSTALTQAAACGDLPIVECLVSYGADVDYKDNVRVRACNSGEQLALTITWLVVAGDVAGWLQRDGARISTQQGCRGLFAEHPQAQIQIGSTYGRHDK